MDPGIIRFVDKMTQGRFSANELKIESMASENSYLKKSLAVVNLYHEGKNPEEISETKKLELEEVVRILRENGKLV
jgi:hypothetical protein